MLFQSALFVATLLCSLVAGFLFAFAIVVMPGIRRLDDAGFLRAFQVIDGVIRWNAIRTAFAILATVLLLALLLRSPG